MGKFKFKANQDGGFTLPPEGTFDLQIIEVKTDANKDGEPQIVPRIRIADGPHEDIKFRQYYTANEERGWALVNLLKACGVDYAVSEAAEGEVPEFEFDPDDLLYAYFRARIELNKNETSGKTYINLKEEQASKLSDEPTTDADAKPAGDAPATSHRRPRPRG